MATQGAGAAKAKGNTRAGCGCLVAVVVVVVIIAAIAGSSGKSESPEKEAQSYITQKSHTINLGRVDYEHVALLIGLASKAGGESETVINEIAKVAQESHDEIDSFRQELFKSGGNEKLSDASLQLSEGANELKNAMGALVAYTGNPNPATLARIRQ